MHFRNIRIVLWVLVGIAIISVGGVEIWHRFILETPIAENYQPPTAKKAAQAAISMDFELIDHEGKVVTHEDFRGSWLLVFFGFTNCPYVCPTALNEVSSIMDGLGEYGIRLRPLFITVDPERDTPEAMAEYDSAFHPSIVGLTGSPEQVKKTAQGFRVYFSEVAEKDTPDGYMMNHSAYKYLINPNGEFESVFSHKENADKITDVLRNRL